MHREDVQSEIVDLIQYVPTSLLSLKGLLSEDLVGIRSLSFPLSQIDNT